MANLNFDASSVEPAQPFEVLPPGKYEVQIVQSEMRATKSGDGQYLWLEMDILSGPYTGRKMWDQLNLRNKNQQTVEIAQRTLSAICHAVGKVLVSDSEELHFKPLLATVKTDPAGPDKYGVQRDARNRIAGYAAVDGMAQPRPTAARQPAPQPRPAPTPQPQGAPAGTVPGQAAARAPATQGNVPPWRRAG